VLRTKKVRLSSSLITILATSVTLSLSLSVRAENSSSKLKPVNYKSPNLVSSLNQTEDLSSIQTTIDNLENFRVVAQTPGGETESPSPQLPPTGESTDPTIELPEFSPPDSQSPPTPTNESPQSPNEPRVLVAEVLVEGANEELTDIIYRTINTEPGRTTTRSQLQEDVNAVYATGFFQNVEVTPADTPLGVQITFLVEPNPILNRVAVETIPEGQATQVLPPKLIAETFGDRYGQILNLRDLQQGIIRINEWYSKNGYELAQVVGSPRVSPDGTVTLVIAEGVIENINVRYFDEDDEPVEGKTRDFIVKREIQLESGNVFKRDVAQRDLQRVFGLGIFEDARFSFSPGKDPSKVVVNVDVVESSSGSVAAGAGFSSSSGLFGTVSFQQQNLGGNNQTLGTELQLGERELLFDLNFTDPWIAGDPYRTSYTVNFFRRRSISLVFNGDGEDIRTNDENGGGGDNPRVFRTGGGINFSRPIPADPFRQRDWTISAGFQYQHVAIKDDDVDVVPISRPEDGSQNLAFSDSGEDDLFIFRLGATRDRRNNRLQPTSGSLFRVSTEQTAPIGSGSILFNRVRASYSQFVPIRLLPFGGNSQTIALNFQAGTVFGDLPPYEAFVLGGSNSVRGYGDGELGSGRSFAQATAEYRFPIFRIVGGALFFDYGTTLGSGDNVPGEPSEVRGLPGDGFGYGAGVRVQSPLGPIRVDYAINDEGDSEVQFGIGEKF
jgi:outer membrane protein insertion porin family